MMRKFFQSAMLIPVLAVCFTACQKESNQDTPATLRNEDAVAAAKATMQARETVKEVFKNVMQFNLFSPGKIGTRGSANANGDNPAILGANGANGCYEVSFETPPGAYIPNKMIIDYKNGDCGWGLKGKLIIEFDASRDSVFKVIAKLDKFYVHDTLKAEGTLILEYLYKGNNGQLVFKQTVQDAKISTPNGDFTTLYGTHTVQQIAGAGNWDYFDDVFEILNGSNYNGAYKLGVLQNSWSTKVTEPLLVKHSCPWISKGKEQLQLDAIQALLDYGNGNCDNKATITIGGSTYEITL
jgi:hypothetical protein